MPEGVVAEWCAGRGAAGEEFKQGVLGGEAVDGVVALDEQGGDFLSREAVGKAVKQRRRGVGGGLALKAGVEVRDQDVVGLDRLEAARDQPLPVAFEDERGGGEADGAIGLRGLDLELCGRAGRGSRFRFVPLVGIAAKPIIDMMAGVRDLDGARSAFDLAARAVLHLHAPPAGHRTPLRQAVA